MTFLTVLFIIIAGVLCVYKYTNRKTPESSSLQAMNEYLNNRDFTNLWRIDSSDFRCMDFTDEDMKFLSDKSSETLKVVDKYCGNDLFFKSYEHKDSKNGKQMPYHHARIRCDGSKYKDTKLIRFEVELHHDQGYWSGDRIVQNYEINTIFDIVEFEKFEQYWKELMDKIFTIDLKSEPNLTDRVRNGEMTYWCEKTHGYDIE